ncbi:hypothetical protein Q4561_08185 [Alteromonas sp. 1_MG-2023]|uniref:hypothetical protein n=1 Tax=Alteromonas sp. 1_MG-2023 TaxID=3062669 RepID=UPI0026E1DF44|nr:hypothetical protein [Alteromonas sp. 1_MG-2023]MDO6567035.1 hypothetical protein [Alteromonas sp. 1_MG-2023]
MRISCMILALTLLSGCSVLSKQPIEQKVEVPPPQIIEVVVDDDICLFTTEPENFDHNCDMSYWLEVWLEADATPWIERKAQLAALGQSQEDKIRGYLLSLSSDTPYQDRLRAQLTIDDLIPEFTDAAALLVQVVVSKPNKQLMELESALSVLSKESTHRGQELQKLYAELKAQQKKLEELLQIETTLMDKNRNN